eukprot:655531-Pelagomonas_calceolata.AAC.15
MAGWQDGCLSAWMAGSMDAYTHKWMDGCARAWLAGRMDVCTHKWVAGWMCVCMAFAVSRRVYGVVEVHLYALRWHTGVAQNCWGAIRAHYNNKGLTIKPTRHHTHTHLHRDGCDAQQDRHVVQQQILEAQAVHVAEGSQGLASLFGHSRPSVLHLLHHGLTQDPARSSVNRERARMCM